MLNDGPFPLHEVSCHDMQTGIRHQSQVEGEIVDRGNLHGQQFLGLEKMVQIGLGMDTVDLTALRISLDRKSVV